MKISATVTVDEFTLAYLAVQQQLDLIIFVVAPPKEPR
jgi:hypothetical protein